MTSRGWAAAGRTDPDGRPGLLQLALLVEECADRLVPAAPPAWAQRMLAHTLGPLARARRLRGAYPEPEERILIGRLGELLTASGSEPVPS